jgi:PAS domain S-box-containing protein
MSLLDMRTIIFSYAIIDIACLMVMVRLWRQVRSRFAGTILFVFDFAFQTSALFLIILRGRIPNWMSYVLASTLVMAGALLGYMGLERFVEQKRSQLYNYILLAAFVVIHAYFTFVQPDQAARNLNVSVGLLVISFQCAWLVLHSVKPGMRQLTRGVGIVFGLYCAINIVRIVEYFVSTRRISDYLQSGIFELLALISNEMLFIFLTYCLALMFNKRLLFDLTIQEEKYSKAFHSSPYAITLTRFSDERIIEANERFLNVTGYQYTDVIGKTTIDLNLWANEGDRILIVDELAQKGNASEREFQFRTKSGATMTGLLSAEVTTINSEKCILSRISDITEQKRVEFQREAALDALRESESRYRSLVENAKEGIYVVQDDMIKFINRAGAEMSGYSEKEIISKPFMEFIYPDDRALVSERCRKRFGGEEIETRITFRFIAAGGDIKWLELGAALIDFEGMPAILNVVNDVTERKRVEEEVIRLNVGLEKEVAERTREVRNTQLALLNLVDDLNQSSKGLVSAYDALNAINKELASFSYSVSHDLRAPLRSIDGFSQALLEDCWDKLDDDGKKYLERIRRATQNMGALIDDMLNLSRVTQSEFCQEPVDLSKMVHAIADANQQNNSLNGLTFNVQEGIIVLGDKRLMNIVLTNLLDNACKFAGKQDYPHIEFGAIVEDSKRIIFVRDNGVGFDMKYAGKLFGTFQRLHRADEFPGTGIGLATVQRVINRHGGQIWAESEEGKGATFYFTLPEE